MYKWDCELKFCYVRRKIYIDKQRRINGHDRPTGNHTLVAGKSRNSNHRWEHLVYPIYTCSQVKALVWYKGP